MNIIKKTGLIFTLLFGLVLNVYAQHPILDQPVSVAFNKLAPDSALNMLQSKIKLNFTYNSRFLPTDKLISANFDSIPLSIILDSIFGNPLLDYQIIGHQLVVLPENLGSKNISANTDTNFLSLSGKILEYATRKPLPYSSVSILHKSIGVISNGDGFFVFEIPANLGNDTLVISHLGYYKEKIPVSVLTSFQELKLHEKIVSLPEILIRNTSARELVRRSLSKIDSNYFIDPFTIRGFYREIVKRNKKYMSYSEALLDIYKRPLRPTLFHDQVKVLKQRKFINYTDKDTVMFKLKGGLAAVLQLDVVRNRPSFMRWSQINDYKYTIRDMTMLDDHLVYVVAFSPGSEDVLPGFDGELYIDAVSLALVQAQFHYARESLRLMKVRFVLKSNGHLNAFPVSVNYLVTYQQFNGKYYIHHILGKIGFRVKRKRLWLRSGYEVSFEMISTDMNNRHPARFARGETVNTNKIFSDFIPGYDFSYWKNENIIVPEANINQALNRLKKEEFKINN